MRQREQRAQASLALKSSELQLLQRRLKAQGLAEVEAERARALGLEKSLEEALARAQRAEDSLSRAQKEVRSRHCVAVCITGCGVVG